MGKRVNALFLWALLGAATALAASSIFYSIDGGGNNIANPNYGTAGSFFAQNYTYTPPPFSPNRPSAYDVARALSTNYKTALPSIGRESAFWIHLFQLALWDIAEFEYEPGTNDTFNVAACDSELDPACTGTRKVTVRLPKVASVSQPGNIPRFKNLATPYMDASFLYGSSESKLARMRSFKHGMLKMSASGALLQQVLSSDYSNELPPGLLPPRIVFLAGDMRINENAAAQTLCIFFAREHNKKAAEEHKKYPQWSDEALFQNARRWVIALWQNLFFEISLPIALGSKVFPEEKGYVYDSDLKIEIDLAAVTVGMQFVNYMLPRNIFMRKNQRSTAAVDIVPMTETYYNTDVVRALGVDNIVHGLVYNYPLMCSPQISNIGRFATQAFTVDAATEAIHLGRYFGIPPTNILRQAYGLNAVASLANLMPQSSSSEKAIFDTVSSLYNGAGGVSGLDAVIGSLGEKTLSTASSSLGNLTRAILLRQFRNIAAGDRFYFDREEAYPVMELKLEVQTVSFSENFFGENSKIKDLPPFLMSANTFKGKEIYPMIVNRPEMACLGAEFAERLELVPGFDFFYILNEEGLEQDSIRLGVALDSTYSTGYFAISIGSEGMIFSDITAVIIDQNTLISVEDYWSEDFNPKSDIQMGGTSDIANVRFNFDSSTLKKEISWTRKLDTNDIYDTAIVRNKVMPLTFAYFPGATTLEYHGGGRHGSRKIIFGPKIEQPVVEAAIVSAIEVFVTRWSTTDKFFHGFAMLLSFCILVPLNIYFARYRNDILGWTGLHGSLGAGSVCFALLSGIYSFIGSPTFLSSTHQIIGVVVLVMLLLQVVFSRYAIALPTRLTRPTVKLHHINGLLLLPVGLIACVTGTQAMRSFFEEFESVQILLIFWICSISLIFAREEFKFQSAQSISKLSDIDSKKRLSNSVVSASEVPTQLTTSPLFKSSESNFALRPKKNIVRQMLKQNRLQKFGWPEVIKRVKEGSLWTVIDGIVFDVENLLPIHPGGPQYLFDYIGSDATDAFVGFSEISGSNNSGSKKNNIGSGEMKRRRIENDKGRLAAKISNTHESTSADKLKNEGSVNEIGASKDLNMRRPSLHYAEKVIGGLKQNGPSVKNQDLRHGVRGLVLHSHTRYARTLMLNYAIGILDTSTFQEWDPCRVAPERFPAFSLLEQATIYNVFRIGTIVEKERLVPKDVANMIYRFNISFNNEEKKMWFLPGEYIELMTIKDNVPIARSYVPLKCYQRGSMDFVIKVYPEGKMTKTLVSRKLGSPILFRGPISNQVILNPNSITGTYDRIGLLVAGSGVSIALQVFDYYLRFGQKTGGGALKNKISILVANNTERDIVFRKNLEEMVEEAQENAKLEFLVKTATPSWNGMTGLIDSAKVESTMPHPLRGIVNAGIGPALASAGENSQETGAAQMLMGHQEDENRTMLSVRASPSVMPTGHRASNQSPAGSQMGLVDEGSEKESNEGSSNSGVGGGGAGVGGSGSACGGKPGGGEANGNSTDFLIVVCGPKAFSDACKGILQEMGYLAHEYRILL